MGRTNKNKNRRLGYMGTAGKNVPLDFEILSSHAWRALTPLQHDILIDWYRNYVLLSRWDSEPLPEGMSFTWAHCRVSVSENAFHTAVSRIVEIGFFERAPRLESLSPGSPRKFLPSARWRQYKPGEAEKAKQTAADREKANRLQEKRYRRKAFRSSLEEK